MLSGNESSIFKRDLANSLTANITRYLPLSMKFDQARDNVADWIDARQREAIVLCVHEVQSGAFAGLILLHQNPEGDLKSLHIGYFLREDCWGKGYASEMLTALVARLKDHGPLQLLAGVDEDNKASCRVLEKAGFTLDHAQSTPTRRFYAQLI